MSDKPSILFINRIYPPSRGATARLLKDLAESCVSNGWEVTIISSGNNTEKKQKNGVNIIQIKANPNPRNTISYAIILAKMLLAALKTKRHDILITLSDPPMLVTIGSIIAKIKKSRHINWCHDLYPDIVPALGIKIPKPILEKLRLIRIKSMKLCDKIIVCGRCMKKQLSHDGIEINKISFIANWYDLELNKCSTHKTNKPSKTFRILYAGNIGLAHPIDIILKTAKIIYERDKNIEFLFVGNGKQFEYIAKQRGSMGIDNIRLLPYQPLSKLCDTMTKGDVHIITMSKKAKGLMVPSKTYSAIATERPSIFIGPQNCEIAKMINEFNAGIVISKNNTQELVDAIIYLKNSKDAWIDAHKGAKQARQIFNPKTSISKWIEQIESLSDKQRLSPLFNTKL